MAVAEEMICPRRAEVGVMPGGPFRVPDHDEWRKGGMGKSKRSCSWCGSMHPDDFMAAVRDGREIGPTDKSYKAYVGNYDGKFYFQHLSSEQRQEFFELLRGARINVGYPRHFYVLPFFITHGD